MPKSATDVMHDVISAAILDAVAALKAASNGLPNTLLRDLGAIHANTAIADLPPALQSAIAASVREAFTRLAREGYTVAPSQGTGGARPPRAQGQGPRQPGQGPRPPGQGPRDGKPPRPPAGTAPRNRRDARPGGPRPKSPRPPKG